jgi:uncharacterized membrane protein
MMDIYKIGRTTLYIWKETQVIDNNVDGKWDFIGSRELWINLNLKNGMMAGFCILIPANSP